MSMLTKVFKLGQNWDQVERVRETVINGSHTVCPMYLLYKDHKGWKWEDGGVPPTRPIASGNQGMNMHLSEIISEIVEPLVDEFEGGFETISTEDMQARFIGLNEVNEDWTTKKWWRGKTDEDGHFMACNLCEDDPKYEYNVSQPELCRCVDSPPSLAGDNKELEIEQFSPLYEGVPLSLVGNGIDKQPSKERIVKFSPSSEGIPPPLEGDRSAKESPRMVTSGFLKRKRLEDWWMNMEMEKNNPYNILHSEQVLPEMLQDYEVPQVLVGCDVEALYPSLNIDTCCETVYQEIMATNITWEDTDLLEGCRYIALNWSQEQCRKSDLRRILPVRRARNGTRPGVTGEGPMGIEVHDQEQWRFPAVKLTDHEKRMVVATVVKIACEHLFKNHLYEFGGKIFRQKMGGPIGLRATCAIARLVMCIWDKLWTEKIAKMGITTNLKSRYMDDGRICMQPIKHGWRWVNNGLFFCEAWALEDKEMSPMEVTSKVLLGTMNNVVQGINFTVETALDHDGTWLPTLDMKVKISNENKILFSYYEKEMAANTVLMERTAMDENQKQQVLAQETVRRMLNTSTGVEMPLRLETLDNFAKKMITSGYSIQKIRRTIANGLKYYENKVKRCQAQKKPIYRTAKNSQAGRNRKKLLSKTNWYKRRKDLRVAKLSQPWNTGGGGFKRKQMETDLPAKSVIFVEQTPRGDLAKKLRELIGRLQHLLGGRIKIVERTGTPLKDLFPLTNLWEGTGCGREDCYPCKQGGEELQRCKKRNIIYESICSICNPGAKKKGPLKTYDGSKPSLYVGETARSLMERAKEHLADFGAQSQKSHIWKHQLESHGGSQDQAFIFKVVETPKNALSRQIGEAVKISRRGGEGAILNAKGEYNRCHITRLTLEEPPPGSNKSEGEGEQSQEWIREQGAAWIRDRMEQKKKEQEQGTRILGRGTKNLEKGSKRRGEPNQGGRRNKKRKYKLIDVQWGSSDIREKMRIDCPSSQPEQSEDSPPSLAGRSFSQTIDVSHGGGESSESVLSPQIAQQSEGSPPPRLLAGRDVISNDEINNDDQYGTKYGDDDDQNVRSTKDDDQADQCVMIGKHCKAHNIAAMRTKVRRTAWTYIKRTGLYGYRTTSSVLWRCPLAPPETTSKSNQEIGISNQPVVLPENLNSRESLKSLDKISDK